MPCPSNWSHGRSRVRDAHGVTHSLRRGHPTGTRDTLIVFALITLVGMNLRTVILAVPPILPLIQRDLALSYTATGLLTSLPVLVMAAGGLPSGILAGRWGARRSVSVGLALLTTGAALRAFWPEAVPLYLFTLLLSAGIAIAQTAVPVLARQWFPTRIGLVSALYSDGLIIGEAIAAGITAPLMRALWGADSWVATFLLWSFPVALTLGLWLWLAPPAAPLSSRVSRTIAANAPPAARAAGKARPARVRSWHLGVLLGAGSLVFFGMNGWIAPYNVALHRAAITPLVLVVMNSAQLPVSLAMTPFAQRLSGRRWPFVVAGIVCIIAICGWLLTPAAAEPFWAALLGGSSAFVFVLGIALPALLATREQVAQLTGLTLTISYGVAFVGPLLGGALWDLTGQPALAFLPVIVAGGLLVILGAFLPPRSAFGLVSELAHGTAGAQHAAPASEAPSR